MISNFIAKNNRFVEIAAAIILAIAMNVIFAIRDTQAQKPICTKNMPSACFANSNGGN